VFDNPHSSRLPWLLLFAVLLFLGLAATLFIQKRFEEGRQLSAESANLQLQQITAVVASELSRDNYQNIDGLFKSYADANQNVVYLRLVARNGFDIGNYQRTSTDLNYVLALKKIVHYSFNNDATILLGISQQQLYDNQHYLTLFLLFIYLVFSSLSIFLQYFTIRSRIAAVRADRKSNLYKAISETNQAIIKLENEGQLFPLVCRCAVEYGGMRMAWVATLDSSGKQFIPAASNGVGLDYLEGIKVSPLEDVPEGRGPIGVAYRENRSFVVNDYFSAPEVVPWKGSAINHGWYSAAAFPITRGGIPYAVLAVYHSEIGAFDQETITLLEEMAIDVSFALDNFDSEQKKKEDEKFLLLAASIYDNSSEAMMITDAENKVISVNLAFQNITGYKADEVVGCIPSLFRSRHHDEKFYESMWKVIYSTGRWIGEIWDEKKNGEKYPLWLTFNSVYDEKGDLDHRIAIFTDISEKKKFDELLWKNANFDSLTELPNRRLFLDRLDQEIIKTHRTGNGIALLFIDLDRFKDVNDSLGHEQGDLLLLDAAKRISQVVRESDTVARLGGDEFTLVISDYGERSRLDRICQELLLTLSKPYNLVGGAVAYTSASIGVALYPQDAENRDELMRHADQAMYAAKAEGRNRYSYFTPSMQEAAQMKQQLTNELRHAISRGELVVYFQPIVELSTGRLVKAEALLRWMHPVLGIIGPAVFIPLAEEFGLIRDIGIWVFLQVLEAVKYWRNRLARDVQVSVNRSPVEFDNEKFSWVVMLDSAKLPGNLITMEITEGLLLKKSVSVQQSLIDCMNNGIEVSIDDFGTGFSALSYLKQFHIDYLKIDQSFIRELTYDKSDKALVEAIIVMAHKLGIRTVAEGVETEAQRDLLISFGCDYAQGNLYSMPVCAEEFEKLLT